MTTLMDTPVRSLAAELRRQLDTKRDLVADTRRVTLADDGAMLVDMPEGVEEYGVTRHAHQQVAESVGVPWKTYDRLRGDHPDLLAHLANGLLAREPKRRLVRTLDGNVRAFLSDGYRPRDNWDLLEALMPILAGRQLDYRQATLTETRMYLKIRLPEFERPIRTAKVGDAIHGGVIVSNSEVGAGSLYVYPYTTVLSCLNGQVHEQYGQRRIHVGKRVGQDGEAWEFYSDETLRLDDAAFFAKVQDTLRAVLDQTVFDAIARQMEDLAGIRVPGSPVPAVEVLAKRHDLTEREAGSVLEHLASGGDLSAFGYVQALTATARDIQDADRQTEIQALAGRMTASPDSWVPALAAVAA